MSQARPSYSEFIANPDRPCAVVVHRGVWQDAPENSLLAIERAIAVGGDVVEIDVRRSRDGDFFLLHDDTLDRVAGIRRAPEDMDSAELKTVALRNRDGGPDNDLTGQTLARLEDAFALTRGQIYLHLDVKDKSLIPDIIALAKSSGMDQQIDVWGNLANAGDLEWIRSAICPHEVLFMAKTRLENTDRETQRALLFDLNPRLCEIYFNDLDQVKELNAQCAPKDIRLWYNTLDDVSCAGFTDTAALENPEAIWGRLMDAGISAIQTDHAEKLKHFITTRAKAA